MIKAQRENFGYSALAIVLVGAIAIVGIAQPALVRQLFKANGFIPHGHCYLWQPNLVWLHLLSDALIGTAYVGISLTLAYLVYRTRREIPFHWMFLAFGSFIIACASTHFMDVLTLWYPFYWLAGVLKAITAFVSVTTALVLPPLVPKALALVETAKLSEERQVRLQEANQELETLYGKLKELDQLKTQFFANVSHELRTPLALILAPVESLLAEGGLNAEQHRSLELIDRNARLLLKQVNDLLDVSKLEAGKMEASYAEVDLSQIVSLMAGNFDGLARSRRIDFTVEQPDRLLTQTDSSKLQRILLNLLSNAFKFTPDGGQIRCLLMLEAAEADRPAQAVIAVRDSGPGVPVEMRSVIFDRFQQGEAGATRRFGGTGLGLAIVKEFVDLLGGSIGVEDAPEGGACFVVTLPIVASDQPSALRPVPPSDVEELARSTLAELEVPTSDAAPAEQQTGKPLVLVVEDNLEMSQFITTSLAANYRTTTASNGADGVQQAIALLPDLILSDMMMPQLSGDQLVQQLRTRPELDATPIVMLTAKNDDDLRIRLLRQGVQDYLMKPFSIEELRARVGNLVAIKRTRDLLQQELASQSQSIESLAQEVSLRRRELQLALEALQNQAAELEQANRMKDEFLAIVSHELRTPLNAILGWAQLLRSRRFDERTVEHALETIDRNAQLQAHLIEDLLDLSRLLRGKLLLDLQPIDLRPVVVSALQTVQPEADAKKIHVESELESDDIPIMGDRVRLQQVFQNLLSNAVKFTPEGGQIQVRLTCQNSVAQVQVSDSGIGIKPENLPFIFDYFWQADSSTTRKYGGLGLGLAIVRQFVELHEGYISAQSEGEGQGATFTVTLPLSVAASMPRYLS